MSQRDEFITSVYKKALLDKDIYFLSVDFGAPALDQFRQNLPNQFVHVGISEQNAIDLASGLALSGKKVFVYGMAPFISLRCIEQIKMSLCQMALPVTIISVGVGLGYSDSGPTHYATEDSGAIRSLINIEVIDVSDSKMADLLPTYLLSAGRELPSFLRMDREDLGNIHQSFELQDLEAGYKFINKESRNVLIIASGYAVKLAVEAQKQVRDKVDVLDLFRQKPISRSLCEQIKNYKKIICVNEQSDGANILGNLLQHINTHMPELLAKIVFKNIGLGEQYFYENLGRKGLHEQVGFSVDKIVELITQ